jgi:ParB-like chromosome segregation protein Spo0J
VANTTSPHKCDETTYVAVNLIHVNPKKYRKLSEAKIQRYVQDFEHGDAFPPISVNNCGDFYTVRDGRHRLQAQIRAGFTHIAVLVRP